MQIIQYNIHYQKQLVNIWSASVKATHHFLKPLDFENIKSMLPTYFNKHTTYLLVDNQEEIVAFMVVDHQKLEALFVDPQYFRSGYGQYLLDYAINHLDVKYVDVNKQNTQAYEFYQKQGFKTYEETLVDDMGLNYPLYRMRLMANDCLAD